LPRQVRRGFFGGAAYVRIGGGSISRASFYRQPAGETPENLELMRIIDEAFMETPWYGSRQMARHLRRQCWCVGRKRIRRLMRKIGLSPIYEAPKTNEPHPQHRIYPYRLRALNIERPDQVLCAVLLGRIGH
jgi:putative transposase